MFPIRTTEIVFLAQHLLNHFTAYKENPMEELSHHYKAQAIAAHDGSVTLESDGLRTIETAPPREFGGPGNLWSPETMLAGAVASCFILTFRAVARASSLPWVKLICKAEGHLQRSEGAFRFTEFILLVKLTVPRGTIHEKAARLLEKAEHGCLISNSLRSTMRLEPEVIEMPA